MPETLPDLTPNDQHLCRFEKPDGDRAAILHTLIETAKLNGLNPEAYLAYTIDQLARGYLASRLGDFLPWNCKDAVATRKA